MTFKPEEVLEAINTDISQLGLKALADHYNKVAAWLGKEPVTRFSDRFAGARRVQHLHVEMRAKLPPAPKLTKPAAAPVSVAVSAAPAAPQPVEKPVEVAAPLPAVIPASVATGTPQPVDPAVAARAAELVQEGKARKRRQKVFAYPPMAELKPLAADSMRGKIRDLLTKGATFAEVEALTASFYTGEDKKRISERAYGFVRLLHTYVGYGLREEGEGDNKKIFVVTPEEWNARKPKRG